jgi:hypothetical protein
MALDSLDSQSLTCFNESQEVHVKECSKCGILKDESLFYLNKKGRPHGTRCKECLKKQPKSERRLAVQREYYHKHKEDQGVKDCTKVRHQKWYEDNKLKVQIKQKEHKVQLKREVMDAYGRECECGEARLACLTLGHTRRDGAKHRRELFGTNSGSGYQMYLWLRKNGFPQDLGLRVQCWNCNLAQEIDSDALSRKVTVLSEDESE